MALILFTMRDVEQQYASFAEIGAGRRRTRGSAAVATAATGGAIAPSKFRPGASTAIDPFAAPKGASVTQQIRQAAKDAPTYLRKTKRGGIAIVKKGMRKAGKAVKRITSPGVRAGAGNISTGVRQVAGDVAVASRRAGRGVLGNISANKGKYALGAAAIGAGAAYLMNRNKQEYSSVRPRTIYFSRR